MVRHCLRNDAGRQDLVFMGVDTASSSPGASECGPYHGLAIDVGRLLDRGRHRRRALAIAYISAAVRCWIPKYGASSIEDWTVEAGHMPERCAGFIIIALGESIDVTGATFADL